MGTIIERKLRVFDFLREESDVRVLEEIEAIIEREEAAQQAAATTSTVPIQGEQTPPPPWAGMEAVIKPLPPIKEIIRKQNRPKFNFEEHMRQLELADQEAPEDEATLEEMLAALRS